ncbi:T9SS type A sorting domain-containing protein [Hymenobacter aquaticus]|uniref:T9SS type A sorting domain-containing protein n=1 Tax=Hymenobacter aquaticus TaxID=1867101 RepID=A0A4Z0Q6Y8_9BACT|nr:pectinesterase family protein [Hymenobacter aquaticus]TGE25838.1 T9SS type A sorting domain-containing protein [Hymenobacter aquaticus]
MTSTPTHSGLPAVAARYWLALCVLLAALLLSRAAQAQTYDAVVAWDGTGTFKTVQAAIDAAPTGRTATYTIYVKNGRYKEKITVPSNKPFLQLIGQSVANTVLTYDDYSGKPMPGGGTYGTSTSASVTINAPDFSALNITFENTTGDAPQALAINVNADRAVFKNCRFLGGQDTVLANGNGLRQYFRDCYIDGTVDFIFGSSRAVFERCVVYAKTRQDGLSGSYITAANTQPGQAYGYVFRNCTIPANRGTTSYVLGRPWQNSTGSTPLAENKVVWLKTTMATGIIKPEGWSTWDAGTNTALITYAEYQSRKFDGRPINVSQRVSWSKQYTAADTAQYTVANLFGTWNPCAVASSVCTSFTPDIAVTNLRGTKGTTTATFTWNLAWAVNQTKFEVFRATTRKGTYAKIGTDIVVPNDTTYNFQTADALPAAGAAYFYYIRASKTGLATQITDTVEISRVPTVTTTGSLGPFAQYAGGPSAARTYQLSAVNLTSNLTVTPPAGFEVSPNNGTTWFTATTPLVLVPVDNVIANMAISVRLNGTATGSYSGNIVHSSPGAGSVSVPVSGTKVTTNAPVSQRLQMWSLRVSAQDSAAVRSPWVAASTPTLRNLYASNGTTVTGITAYSSRYGQAFGATANGDGSWGTAVGGPGGNLNRRFYEQFTIRAQGVAVRIDSLLLWSAFYNTNSNTKLAVVYSKTGFTTNDSTDVSGGIGPAGALNSTANGGFATPIVLNNQNTGTNQNFRLALAGASDVRLESGQTLTVRLYWSCGSGSAGRYGLLRDVQMKGEPLIVTGTHAAAALAAGLAVYPNPAQQQLTLTHPKAGADASVTVYSFDGRKVATFSPKPGVEQTPLKLDGLAKGTYLLRYSSGKESLTTKFIRN